MEVIGVGSYVNKSKSRPRKKIFKGTRLKIMECMKFKLTFSDAMDKGCKKVLRQNFIKLHGGFYGVTLA